MKILLPLICIVTLSLANCSPDSKTTSPLKQMEEAHLKELFIQRETIAFDLYLEFRGNERLNASVTLMTNSSRALIENSDSTKIYVDKNKVYHSPQIENPGRVRFDAYTWSYFFLFPYKLDDPGTEWSTYGTEALDGFVLNDKNSLLRRAPAMHRMIDISYTQTQKIT